MNEIQQHKLAKQYKEYYKFYNTTVRPLEEKRPVKVVEGVVKWDESDRHSTTSLVAVR